MKRDSAMTRRRALRHLSAGTLLSLGLWPGCAQRSAASAGSFRFIAVNDTHHMSPACSDWLERVAADMKTHDGIDFCLLAGDLTEHGEENHLEAVRAIFSQLGYPTYVVIGNHDYVSPDSRETYDRVFPDRLNYWFQHRGWQFIGLDTSHGQRYQNTLIQPHTFAWLEKHLPRMDPARPTVVFTHFPLGAGVTYRPRNADALLERFIEFNLQAVFNGHFHGFTEKSFHQAQLTTNQCCALKRGNHDGTTEKGYMVCQARDGRIQRQRVTFEV